MTNVWYSRRPEVAEMAQRVTLARADQYRQIAGNLPNTTLEPGTGIPLAEVLVSVAQELELRLTGSIVVDLAPGDPCPDPSRCFYL